MLTFDGTGYLTAPARILNSFPCSILISGTRSNSSPDQAWVSQGSSAAARVICGVHYDSTEGKGITGVNPGGYGMSATKSSTPNVSATTPKWLVLNFYAINDIEIMFGDTTSVRKTDGIMDSDQLNLHDRTVIGGRMLSGIVDQMAKGALAECHFFSNVYTASMLTTLLAGTAKPEEQANWVNGVSLQDFNSGGTYPSMANSSLIFTATGGVTSSAITHPVTRSTPVAVSFSGPVPTRNGVLGTATTFANAGFFAGNLTPFTYSSVGTALPAGVTLNTSTGVLSLAASGAAAGTTSGIIIRATDTGANIANTNAYSIVIAASNAAPTFPGNISNLSGTAGSAITPVNVSGQFSDTDTLTYSASPSGTAWPAGLVVNSSTGIISGTVAGAGTTSGLKVRATDTASQTVDSNAFNAVIAAGSATRTWTPTIKLEALADETPFANWAIHAVINDMAGNLIGTKTGLTSSSAGLPPPFTSSFGSLATDYRVTYIDDVDLTIFAVENLRCV